MLHEHVAISLEMWGLRFSYGHSVAGDAENYAYIGLYKIWGRHRDTDTTTATDAMPPGTSHRKLARGHLKAWSSIRRNKKWKSQYAVFGR
jgi:hypothetical protein